MRLKISSEMSSCSASTTTWSWWRANAASRRQHINWFNCMFTYTKKNQLNRKMSIPFHRRIDTRTIHVSGQFIINPLTWKFRPFSHSANGPWKKQFEFVIFPTKCAIPKSLSRLAIGQVSFGDRIPLRRTVHHPLWTYVNIRRPKYPWSQVVGFPDFSLPFCGDQAAVTLPETNIFAPENGWLEYYFQFLGPAHFQVRTVSSREGRSL